MYGMIRPVPTSMMASVKINLDLIFHNVKMEIVGIVMLAYNSIPIVPHV